VKRLFVLGPTGSDRKYYTKKLKETLSFSVIETGALLRKEIIKKSDLAGDISQAFLENRYGKNNFLYLIFIFVQLMTKL
jgi:adenylate kinase family enzyme